MFQKFYSILELSPDASVSDIKRAYRKLAKQYHPDISNEPNAREMFVLITQAYDAIMDRKMRPQTRYTFQSKQQRRSNYRKHVNKREGFRATRKQRAQEYSNMEYGDFERQSQQDHPFPILKYIIIAGAAFLFLLPAIAVGLAVGSLEQGFVVFVLTLVLIGGGTAMLYGMMKLVGTV
jgi:hypothetical protein